MKKAKGELYLYPSNKKINNYVENIATNFR